MISDICSTEVANFPSQYQSQKAWPTLTSANADTGRRNLPVCRIYLQSLFNVQFCQVQISGPYVSLGPPEQSFDTLRFDLQNLQYNWRARKLGV